MTCVSCSKSLPDGSAFCEFCGASQGVAHAVNSPGASAAAIAGMSGQLLKSLSLGEKFSAAGALAATLGFFLPWFTTADLASIFNKLTSTASPFGGGMLPNAPSTSFSGIDLAKFWGIAYLVLALGIASGVLFFVSSKSDPYKRMTISGFQIFIGSLFGPWLLFELLFIPLMQSVAGTGLWLMALGFCSVVAGGLITLSRLANATR